MSDVWLRLLVVLAVVGLAALLGFLARRGRAWRRRRVRMPGIGRGLVLFTSATCASCERARQVVTEVDAQMTEVSFEEHPEVFSEHRVERVPAVAYLDDSGRGWLAEGIPTERRLRRWLNGSAE